MYRTVTFKTHHPEEWTFSDKGDAIRPGSLELAKKIAAEIRATGATVSSVEQHSYYGWEFTTKFRGYTFDNVLNPVACDCYLTIHFNWFWLHRLLLAKPDEILDQYCSMLNCCLGRLEDVFAIGWLLQ